MPSESCFDWWLSGLWWVRLSSAGWRPLILSSFPQPSSFLFLRCVPFWFGSEMFAFPFFAALPVPPPSLLPFKCLQFLLAICLFSLFMFRFSFFFAVSTPCTGLMLPFSLVLYLSCFLLRCHDLGGYDLRREAVRWNLYERHPRSAGEGRAPSSATHLHNRRLHGHGQMYVLYVWTITKITPDIISRLQTCCLAILFNSKMN